PLEALLTRYGLHELPALQALLIFNGYRCYITDGRITSQHLPLELTPPPASRMQYTSLKCLTLVGIPHCPLEHFEHFFPVLQEIHLLCIMSDLHFYPCERCVTTG